MLIIICAMIPSSIILPQEDLSLSIIPLQSNWQIQGLFLTSLLCGPQIGIVVAISAPKINKFSFAGGSFHAFKILPPSSLGITSFI